jgi:hypothetical protein
MNHIRTKINADSQAGYQGGKQVPIATPDFQDALTRANQKAVDISYLAIVVTGQDGGIGETCGHLVVVFHPNAGINFLGTWRLRKKDRFFL